MSVEFLGDLLPNSSRCTGHEACLIGVRASFQRTVGKSLTEHYNCYLAVTSLVRRFHVTNDPSSPSDPGIKAVAKDGISGRSKDLIPSILSLDTSRYDAKTR